MTVGPSAAGSATDGLLGSLDPEQRAAATLLDGPAQVIAPAGSGKTTTLIARLGVLLERGVAADRIGVVTFNRDAAAELAARIASRPAPESQAHRQPLVRDRVERGDLLRHDDGIASKRHIQDRREELDAGSSGRGRRQGDDRIEALGDEAIEGREGGGRPARSA